MKRIMFSTLAIVFIYGMTCTAADVIIDINKDVHNASGSPAWDFRIVLDGVPTIESHYDGYPNSWRFGNFNYTVENETTILRWSEPLAPNGDSSPIPDCNWVHIGYRLDRPADILEACWTDENGQCLPNGKVEQVYQDVDVVNGTATLTLKNTLQDGVTVTIGDVQFVVLDDETPLANLNAQNTDLAFEPVPGGEGEIVLESGQSHTLTIPGDIPKGKFVVIRKVGNEYVDFSQFWEAPPVEPPAVSEWGLIVMALFLVTVGAIAIVRRRGQVAT